MINDAESQKQIAAKIMEISLSVRETEKAVKRFGKENLNLRKKI